MLALLSAGYSFGEEILLPVADGNVALHDVHTEKQKYPYTNTTLFYTVENRTSQQWFSMDLEFRIGSFCGDEVREWSGVVHTGWLRRGEVAPERKQEIETFKEKVVCSTEVIKFRFASAISCTGICLAPDGLHYGGDSERSLDVRADLEAIRAKRLEDAAKAKAAFEEEKRRAAAEAARRGQIETEELRKQALANAEQQRKLEVERRKAEAARAKEAKEEIERAKVDTERQRIEMQKLRAGCQVVYDQTIDKRRAELTIRQEEQVAFCQMLGLYPPK